MLKTTHNSRYCHTVYTAHAWNGGTIPEIPPLPLSHALILLLLGRGRHLLAECAVGHLEAVQGAEPDVEDGENEDGDQKAVENT